MQASNDSECPKRKNKKALLSKKEFTGISKENLKVALVIPPGFHSSFLLAEWKMCG